MIHGPDLAELQSLAKARIQQAFTAWAEKDGVPPTLRAMYVRKAEQAQLVLDGGSSALIEGEAALRHITPEQMAQTVVSMAAAGGDTLELKRIETNLRIEAASSAEAVIEILDGLGISLSAD